MKVKLNRNYKYYLPTFFGGLLFVFIYIFLIGEHKVKLKNSDQVLSKIENGDTLITDKSFAKIAVNSPLILGDETTRTDRLQTGEPIIKTVEIIDPSLDLVEIIDPNTIITFKNASGSTITLNGIGNTWRAEIAVDGVYSQMFEKPGKFEFSINNKPIGVIRVRWDTKVF